MTYTQFKEKIVSFSSNRSDLTDITNLLGKVNISMTQVCRDAVPLVLIKDSTSGRPIFRRIDNKAYICVHTPVTDIVADIEMDESLLDAVALHVIAGIETSRAPAYMKMYWNIVDNHEQMLINTDLASNMVILEDYVNNTPEVIVDKNEYLDSLDSITLETKIVGAI